VLLTTVVALAPIVPFENFEVANGNTVLVPEYSDTSPKIAPPDPVVVYVQVKLVAVVPVLQ
jgi:hypothetical protein